MFPVTENVQRQTPEAVSVGGNTSILVLIAININRETKEVETLSVLS